MFMWVSTKRGQYFDRIFNFRNLCSIPFTFHIIYGHFVTPASDTALLTLFRFQKRKTETYNR